jgi:MFS superfamily sulfate permease-like transporter
MLVADVLVFWCGVYLLPLLMLCSHPVITGFTSGAALVIATGQVGRNRPVGYG